MDWSKGFSASYYMTIVDPVTWRDIERIEITDGKVSRNNSRLRQSADIKCTTFQPDREYWIRLWLDASQSGDVAHEALFTGLAIVSESTINATITTYPVSCYSVLKPANDILIDRGFYVMRGTDIAQTVRSLLSVTPAPVDIEETSPTLLQTVIAEGNETHLSMVDKILSAVNWRMKIDGDGTIRIGPWNKTPQATFGIGNDVIEPIVKLKSDWYKCPNVYRVVNGDLTAIARDDDPNSILSTVTRGREVWAEDTGVALNSGEGIEQYAARRLAESQSYAYSVSYRRRYDPSVNVTDAVKLHYPEQELLGDYIVASQSILLSHGCPVSEEVQR